MAGFTLIELIVVIVLLGVLAATALPKFMDLAKDARIAVVQRTAMEVTGAYRMANMKCKLIAGCEQSGQGVLLTAPNGLEGRMYNGYPTGLSRPGFFHGIKDWIQADSFTVFEHGPARTSLQVSNAPNPTNCAVRYTQSETLGELPLVEVLTSGC